MNQTGKVQGEGLIAFPFLMIRLFKVCSDLVLSWLYAKSQGFLWD